MAFETIILRFRDLVTEAGDTIREHSKFINEEGCVWWAWWNKGNEVVPSTELSLLRTWSERDEGLAMYLVDSGQKKFYEAVCKDIKFSEKGFIPSPDATLTPTYYRSQKYRAWFRFTSLKECCAEQVRQFSYVQTDDLFADKSSDYSKFSGKRVYGLAELIQQNRTVWFVRKFDSKNDRDHEIILMDAHIVEPADFSSRYVELEGNALMWLSDLHLDSKSQLLPKFLEQRSLTKHIRESNMNLGTGFSEICGLIISGDITNCGKEEGFKIAEDLIQDLNRELRYPLQSSTIITCPGNHDFARKNEKLVKNKKQKDKSPSLIADHPDSYKGYCDFYHELHGKNPNEFFACGRKFLTSSGRTVEIAALNSVTLQQYEDFEGHGFLSQEQLDYVAKEMKWDQNINSCAIRIAVMHHHYLPTCYVERIDPTKASSVVYDAERLAQWMKKYNVRILLHGHKHKSFSAVVGFPKTTENEVVDLSDSSQLYVIGMGGTGAAACDNMYAIIRFLADSVCFDFYRIYPDNSSSGNRMHSIVIKL